MRKIKILRDEGASVLLIFALLTSVLILFTGLAIDGGILYLTKAKLSAAVDGACLAAMRNYSSEGETVATQLGADIFNANYGSNAPTPSITWPTDQYGNQTVQVTATVPVHTLFMQIVPAFAIVPVSDTAVSTRNKLIMTIVLDRSGSMASGCGNSTCDGGMVALQAAVPDFVDSFDNTAGTGDEVGMVSFSSDSTINVPVEYSFQSPINTAIAAMQPVGGTFGTGGPILTDEQTQGPPFTMAGNQNDSIPITAGQNVIKVIVYFTDGLMNTLQDNFYCSGKGNQTQTVLNYGGYDVSDGTNDVAIMNPTKPGNPQDIFCTFVPGDSSFTYTGTNCGGTKCVDNTGKDVTTFPSQQTGTQVALSRIAVTAEAQYRALQTATTLRSEATHPNFIYTIGLGSGVGDVVCPKSGTPYTEAFLATLANDPNGPTNYPASGNCTGAVYNANQTAGEFFYISSTVCPGSNCAAAVKQVFQVIYAKIALRLTQ